MAEKTRRTFSRRDFMKTSSVGVLAAMSPLSFAQSQQRLNILLITCDQMGLHAMSGHGSPWLKTPHLDRLKERGTTFLESHSTNPVCSPARSSIYTGRMPVETGVITNNRGITPGMPNIGEWLRQFDYETVYAGKWHMWKNYPVRDSDMLGFKVLPAGPLQGDLEDSCVSRSCEAYLRNYKSGKPFFLAANFLQPHDICFWGIAQAGDEASLTKTDVPFERYGERFGLPELPPNNKVRPEAPETLDRVKQDFTDEQWRYYLYIYNRMTEMLDSDVGRLLDTLEQTGLDKNTVVIFTSDHGDGNGRHSHVQKWYPYEESVKVPLIISWPAGLKQGQVDEEHLVLGTDIVPTVCDLAGCEPPPHMSGKSLRPILEGHQPETWRDFLVTEHHIKGRMVRSKDYKYVHYEDDPVEQLFNIREDPWETKNLYKDPAYAKVLADHRRMLKEWNSRMIVAPESPHITIGSPKKIQDEWAKKQRAAALNT